MGGPAGQGKGRKVHRVFRDVPKGDPSPLAPFLVDRSLLPKRPPTKDGNPHDVTKFVGR